LAFNVPFDGITLSLKKIKKLLFGEGRKLSCIEFEGRHKKVLPLMRVSTTTTATVAATVNPNEFANWKNLDQKSTRLGKLKLRSFRDMIPAAAMGNIKLLIAFKLEIMYISMLLIFLSLSLPFSYLFSIFCVICFSQNKIAVPLNNKCECRRAKVVCHFAF